MVTKQELDDRRNEAHELVKSGNYQKALELFIYVFESSRDYPAWGGVRLSFLLSEIKELGRRYPPATQKLQEMVVERENAMRTGKVDFQKLVRKSKF